MRSRAFAASLAGRLCYGIVSLSLILELTAGGRDYGLAGLVMALFGLAVVLVSPFRAWLVDRHGPRLALPPMTASFAVVLVAIAVIPARAGVNDAAIAALAVAAGACAPPLGVVMRALWRVLINDSSLMQNALPGAACRAPAAGDHRRPGDPHRRAGMRGVLLRRSVRHQTRCGAGPPDYLSLLTR